MKPRYEKRSHWKPTRRDWVLAAVLIPTGVVGLLISWWVNSFSYRVWRRPPWLWGSAMGSERPCG